MKDALAGWCAPACSGTVPGFLGSEEAAEVS
jgi:hypothetical protein